MLRNLFSIDAVLEELLRDKPLTVDYTKVVRKVVVANGPCNCNGDAFIVGKGFNDLAYCSFCGQVYIAVPGFGTIVNIYKLVPVRRSRLTQHADAVVSALLNGPVVQK